MNIVVTQQPGAQYNGGDKPTWEIPFNIEGTNDCIQARIALLAASDGIYDGLVRQTPKVEHNGFNFFKGTVIYGLNDTQPSEGSIDYQFEVGGKTEKIYQGISCTRYPSDAPDYQGAIGVVKNSDQIEVQAWTSRFPAIRLPSNAGIQQAILPSRGETRFTCVQ